MAKTPPSNHGRPKASAMARNATAIRVVEASRGVGELVPSRSVWDWEQPSIPFSCGEVINPITQTLDGCQEAIYEEVTTGDAERIRSRGAMISSSFVVWQDGPEGRKGRFVVKLLTQSKHWPQRSVRMETLPEYALELERGEKMVSFDI
jgi:hypothetical protein